ncbi:C10orf11 [Cordylochernes scorpioides]|uniref:C10orf11 n=1 Tax=Cordylochernes scorpioides TaxID=51811 RepID=A0ABY6LA19_9ARAC|nr:C10orf11 [Cordylochernes scorpioides]
MLLLKHYILFIYLYFGLITLFIITLCLRRAKFVLRLVRSQCMYVQTCCVWCRRLDGLEHFSKLQELVLDNNQLEDGSTFPYLPHLHTLSLNKNCKVCRQFSNLEEVVAKVKSSYPQLRYLSLLGNPACPDQLTSLAKDEHDYRNYRLVTTLSMCHFHG